MVSVCAAKDLLGRTAVKKHVPTTAWIVGIVTMDSVTAMRVTLVSTAQR